MPGESEVKKCSPELACEVLKRAPEPIATNVTHATIISECEAVKYDPEPIHKRAPEPIANNITHATIISECEAVKYDPEPLHEIIKCPVPPKRILDCPSQDIRDDGTDPTSKPFKSTPETTCNIKCDEESKCKTTKCVQDSKWKVKCEPGSTCEDIKCSSEVACKDPKCVPTPIATNGTEATIISEGEDVKSCPEPTTNIIKCSAKLGQ